MKREIDWDKRLDALFNLIRILETPQDTRVTMIEEMVKMIDDDDDDSDDDDDDDDGIWTQRQIIIIIFFI